MTATSQIPPPRHGLVSGTVLLGFGQAAMVLSAYGINILVARYMGSELFGEFALVISMLFMLYPFVQAGIPTLIKRFIASSRSYEKDLMRKSVAIQIVTASILIVCVFLMKGIIGNVFSSQQTGFLLLIASLDLPFTALLYSNFAVHSGRFHYGRQSVLMVTYSLCRIGMVAFVVIAGHDLINVFVAYVASTILIMPFSWPFKLVDEKKLSFGMKSLTVSSAVVILYSFTLVAYQNAGVIVVKLVTNDSGLAAIFQVGNILGKIAQFAGVALAMSMFPLIAKAETENLHLKVRELLTKALCILVIFIFPLGLYLFYDASAVVKLLFGQQYVQSIEIVPILFLAYSFGAIVTLFGSASIAKGNIKLALIFGLILSTLGISLSVFLTRHYGYTGAAYGVFWGGMLASAICMVVMFRYIDMIMLGKIFLLVTLATLITLMLIWVLICMNFWVLFNFCTGAILYFFLIHYFGGFRYLFNK
jgi:O-antigen/teichoic acid export membrane protein